MEQNIYTTSEYLDRNPTWHMEESVWKAEQILKIIEKNNVQPSSICEIGCGAGEILNQLFLRMNDNVSFTGYEISPHAFELCKQKEKERLHYTLGNVFDYVSAHYNLAMAIDVVEHIEDYFTFLRNFKKKGDYKIMHIPLEMSVKSVLTKYYLKSRKQFGHIQYFSKESLLAVLEDLGYEVVDYFYTSIVIHKQPRALKSLILRCAFRINKDFAVRLFGGYSLLILAK
ncbi:MAG: class I SAM-dependent methyltransferase [Bacteroidales bacterium]|jgi:cyclopropane fatty-acyl-phospholipid synthase-like methyltransferase|nr:class I SAM-dependent methyltransferase [Bacteroidales bacterium]